MRTMLIVANRCFSRIENQTLMGNLSSSINPFVPNAPFLYPLKASENRKGVFLHGCPPLYLLHIFRTNLPKKPYASGEINLVVSSYKNRELKVKLWWVGAHERKKSAFFCNIYFVLRIFFLNLCFISMYWVLNNIQNIYTFTYQKTLLHTFFCLFLKSSKAFSVSLTEEIL